jgi:hypothetical protein
VGLKRDYYPRSMASMAAKGIVLPSNLVTAIAIGFEDQSSEMSSMAMAPHRKLKKVNRDAAVPVDNWGNAASNMIRMKLFIFFTKAKRPAENSPAVLAYSIRTSFS